MFFWLKIGPWAVMCRVILHFYGFWEMLKNHEFLMPLWSAKKSEKLTHGVAKGGQPTLGTSPSSRFLEILAPGRPRARPESRKRPVAKRPKGKLERERGQRESWKGKVGREES